MELRSKTYLNEEIRRKHEKEKNAGIIFGVVLIFIVVIAMIQLSMGLANLRSENEEKFMFVFCICLIILGLFLVCRGVLYRKSLANLYRYDSIFVNDRDGFVSLEELTNQMGRNSKEILKELDKLFRKDAFQGCTLYKQGTPGVMLGDAYHGENAAIGFKVVSCTNCGGANRARVGTYSVCEYCGSSFLAQ